MQTEEVGRRGDGAYLRRGVLAVLSGVMLTSVTIAGVPVFTRDSVTLQHAPTINGYVMWGEWSGAARVDLDNGYLAMANDAIRLYLLINLLEDTDDTGSDYFWLTFDVDGDTQIDPMQDINYALIGGNLRFQYYTGPGTWTGMQPACRSSRGKGFSSSFADLSMGHSFFDGPPYVKVVRTRHRVWELAIDLGEIQAEPGDTIRLGLRVSSANPSFTENLPAGFTHSFSSLGAITLAVPRNMPDAPTPGSSVQLDGRPVELTQAIQDRDNSLPLVADKDTVARVYTQATGPGGAQPSVVYLHGARGSLDLPGSPLAVRHTSPAAVDREVLANTANFLLPGSWDDPGVVTLRPELRDYEGHSDVGANLNFDLFERRVPTYWLVRVNEGSAAAPDVVTDDEIAEQMDYLEAVYPVSEVNWRILEWESVGEGPHPDIIGDLNELGGEALLAWVVGYLITGSAPFDFPDEIFGLRTVGAGSSDPTWGRNAGPGLVAWGGRSSAHREVTLAHETNHNADRSSDGTWGRHTPFGCGAGGPDPDWPYTDAAIQEVGFDTRLPWVDGSGTRYTVMDAEYPDLMSYCQIFEYPGENENQRPTQWISPYRWEHLFESFREGAGETEGMAESIQSCLYVSGRVEQGGAAVLHSVFDQPGVATQGIPPGGYSIRIRDIHGKELQRTSFALSFVGVEGEKRNVVSFHFCLPRPQGMHKVELWHESLLDSIAVSSDPPKVEVLAPNGGETWKGKHTVEWKAEDPDSSSLTYKLLYSNTEGRSWHPVAARLESTSYNLDASSLPGGDDRCLFRVMCSDGVNTASDDSDEPFTVVDGPPRVKVLSPLDLSRVDPGQPVQLVGWVEDGQDGELDDDRLVWFCDGEAVAVGRRAEVVLPRGVKHLELRAVDSDGLWHTARSAVFAFERHDGEMARFVSMLRDAEDRLEAGFTAPEGAHVAIDISDDNLETWHRAGSMDAPDGVGLYTDPDTPQPPGRAYRAVVNPSPGKHESR